MSGRERRSRQRATRRRSPPEILATSMSPGGTRSASIASSTVRSRSQALAASILSCKRAGAVGAEHTDLGSVEEREPDAAEDLPLGRDDFPKILDDERVFAGHVVGARGLTPPSRLPPVGRRSPS